MKKLKNILVASILTMSVFTATFITSCNTDKCKSVVCSNGGTCTDGSCTCPSGYEGTTCDSLSRTKFIANYNVTASCQSSYVAGITSSTTGDTKVIISNIANLNTVIPGNTASVVGTVDKSSITIARQFATGLSTTEVEGNGTISGSTLTMNYSVYVSGTSVATCTSTNWVKQ